MEFLNDRPTVVAHLEGRGLQPAWESQWLIGSAEFSYPGRTPIPAGDAVLVGAHGGAGVSTLAGLLPTLVEAGGWPQDGSVPEAVVRERTGA